MKVALRQTTLWLTALIALGMLGFSGWSQASIRSASEDPVLSLVKAELDKVYPGARIEFAGEIRWLGGRAPADIARVEGVTQSPQGGVFFTAHGEGAEESASGFAAVSIWVPGRIAIRRILPGEALAPEMFKAQNINVATGSAYEFRGVLLPTSTPVNGLEARQTLLEGGFLTTSAVRRIPDVRRGDIVRIRMISGDLTLSTQGVAEEPGYVNGQVRVMAGTTKRELVGRLRADSVVEIML